jgi:hypothetical protein
VQRYLSIVVTVINLCGPVMIRLKTRTSAGAQDLRSYPELHIIEFNVGSYIVKC